MRIMWITAVIVFLLDQATKWYVLAVLELDTVKAVDIFPPYLQFRMAWNEGINFGLFGGMDLRWVLVGVALAVSAFVIWWMRREGGSRWTYIAAGLLVGGALGNALDRVIYGAVADFLNMSCCGVRNPYAFNVADIAVFAGALGLVFFSGEGAKKARVTGRKGSGSKKP